MATLISKNMVVPKGAVRTYVQNTDNYYLAALILGQYEALEGEVYFEPSLINYGEMHLDLGGFNTGTLITISASLQWEYGKVENYGLMSAVVPDALHVGVLGGPGYCPDVYNAGRIIGEAQESATGFGAGDAGHSFTNAATGTVSVRSGELSVAVSFHGGGTVINHGRLLAHATGGGFEHIPDQAWGVTFGFGGFFGRPNVTNSGLIQATDDDPGTQHSIGIRIHGEGTANIVNSGTIRGDYAIRKYSDQYTTPHPVTVENSGLIEGRVDLGWGDDVLDNSHRIVGQVELSNGDDVYAGALGTVTGPVYGGAGNDRLTGGAGDELLSGGEGNDTLEGSGGNDRISGGAGSDTASYAAAPAAVTLRLTATGAQATGGAGSDTMSSIENLTGSAFNDRLTGSPAGNVLDGGGGIDTMTGGSGNDSYHVDATADKVVETSAKGGTDTVLSSASYTLPAYVENLILSGTAAVNGTGNGLANAMTGNGAANRLNGGAGSDTMAGGKGNDIYYVDNAGDRVVETYATGGTDRVVSTVSYVLGSNLEHLTLSGLAAVDGTGNSLANAITGNDAANILKGGERNDTLTGAAGNDSLYGGTGNDSLQGDAGADRFYFDTPLSASTNVDRILAFSTVDDSLYLDRDIFKAIAANGTLAAAAFRVGTAAGDSSDRIVYDQSTGRIYYDPDGSGGAAQILFATVAAGTQLTSSDFVAFI